MTLEQEIDVWLCFWGTAVVIFTVLWVVTQCKFKK